MLAEATAISLYGATFEVTAIPTRQRISSSGVVLDPLGIRISSGQALTAVAAVPDGYLLISGTNCGSVDAEFVANDGRLAPRTHVADWAGLCIGDVEVATNGETVLADWDGKGALLDIPSTHPYLGQEFPSTTP